VERFTRGRQPGDDLFLGFPRSGIQALNESEKRFASNRVLCSMRDAIAELGVPARDER